VAVIGGRNSAAVAALDLFRHGARVTLIHRRAQLSDRIKYWLRPDIENRIKDGEIKALFETRIVEIRPDSILVAPAIQPSGADPKNKGPVQTIKNDFVFALTGYQPDVDFIRRAGVQVESERLRPCCSPQTLESNVPGLYLAGVIVAGLDTNEIFIENGRFHAQQIIPHIVAQR
jgi:thioredoxin reductase (NADPH)